MTQLPTPSSIATPKPHLSLIFNTYGCVCHWIWSCATSSKENNWIKAARHLSLLSIACVSSDTFIRILWISFTPSLTRYLYMVCEPALALPVSAIVYFWSLDLYIFCHCERLLLFNITWRSCQMWNCIARNISIGQRTMHLQPTAIVNLSVLSRCCLTRYKRCAQLVRKFRYRILTHGTPKWCRVQSNMRQSSCLLFNAHLGSPNFCSFVVPSGSILVILKLIYHLLLWFSDPVLIFEI